jgi:hypothetical protein
MNTSNEFAQPTKRDEESAIYPSQNLLNRFLGNLLAASSSTSQINLPSFGSIRWAGYISGLYLPLNTSAKVCAFFPPVTIKVIARALFKTTGVSVTRFAGRS